MQAVFNDMESEVQAADTLFTRRELESISPKGASESTGSTEEIDTTSVHDDFLLLREASSAILDAFLIFWWDARLCHHEFRFNFLAALRKRTKFRGRGATNYLKKTE